MAAFVSSALARTYLCAVARHPGLLADEGVCLVQQAGGVRAGLGHNAARQAVGLLQQGLSEKASHVQCQG